MAQADLLRYVEVVSTVSGGSLVGALYLMHLKQELEAAMPAAGEDTKPPVGLPQACYRDIVETVEQTMRELVSLNLRMRLLINPLRWAGILLGWTTLGAGFARFLDTHLFKNVPAGQARWTMRDLRIGERLTYKHGGTENYNRAALWKGHELRREPASAATRLVINTTCLNSSGRFWFSHAEFGEWHLGYVRLADIKTALWPRKWLLQEVNTLPDSAGIDACLEALHQAFSHEFRDSVAWPALDDELRALWPLLRWWRQEPNGCSLSGWGAMADLCQQLNGDKALDELARLLRAVDMGLLRRLKNFAWLLDVGRHGQAPCQAPVTDGMNELELAAGFSEALKSIDERWGEELGITAQPGIMFNGSGEKAPLHGWAGGLLKLVTEIYHFRCAEFMSPHVWREWQDMPLSDVVAASASFPPVFPPHVLSTLVDDRTIRRLGLTDGGVFDNLGTTALLDEQCTMIISSDPGGVFDTQAQEVSVGRFGLMSRLGELLGERPNQLYRHELRERRRMGEALARGAANAADFLRPRALTVLSSFRIARTRELSEAGSMGGLLSKVRTDLDVFGPIEQDALIRQGEARARHHLSRRFAAHSGSPLTALTNGGVEAPPSIARIKYREYWVLALARHRFWRLFRLWSTLPVGLGLAGLWMALWGGGVLMQSLGQAFWSLIALPQEWIVASPVGQWRGVWPYLHAWQFALTLFGVGLWALLRHQLFDTVFRLRRPLRRQWRWLLLPIQAGCKPLCALRSRWWYWVAQRLPTWRKRLRTLRNPSAYLFGLALLPAEHWWWWLVWPMVLVSLLTVIGVISAYLLTPLYTKATKRQLQH